MGKYFNQAIIATTILLGINGLTNKLLAQYTKEDSIQVQKIAKNILNDNTMHNDLKILCKDIGNRLSGSEAAEKAIKWGVKTLKEAGADSVWLQPTLVPKWVRGSESLLINFGKGMEHVSVLSLGNTHGTDGKPLTAEIVVFNTIEALKNAKTQELKGKFILLNIPFPQDVINTFEGYSHAVVMRGQGPTLAAEKGAAGLIIRAVSTTFDDAPHTGTARTSSEYKPVPAVSVGTETADRIAKSIQNGQKVTAQLTSNCKMEGEVLSYNVIGEYFGKKYRNKYIVVGGHLDSWDIGEGAHDDGVGCVQSIEVLRTLKQVNYKPNHTIRVVLFMNEENGNRGGIAYADSAVKHKEQHLFALESDAGGFTPRGFGLVVDHSKRQQAQSWIPLLQPFGINSMNQESCGVDITPLKNTGVAAGELLPENQRYFDFHHSRHDVFEAVNQRELKLGAAAMTSFLYLIDTYWQ